MKLHIFQSEHDLALAHLKQFHHSSCRKTVAGDLCIPALWGGRATVLMDDIDLRDTGCRHFGRTPVGKVDFITNPQLKHLLRRVSGLCSSLKDGTESLKGELERIGLPEIILPTDESR